MSDPRFTSWLDDWDGDPRHPEAPDPSAPQGSMVRDTIAGALIYTALTIIPSRSPDEESMATPHPIVQPHPGPLESLEDRVASLASTP